MIEIIEKYFPHLSDTQKQQFAQLKSLYHEWNEQINVISRKDMDNFYERHVLHSLGIAKIMMFKPGTCILDVGTGGGFPGIPLAILFPECTFHLVDSIGKKIKVVNGVSEGIGLKNVTTFHGRAEDMPHQYHFIVSRAVTRLKPFWSWIRLKFNKQDQFNDLPNGILYLKGGDLEDEIKEFNRPAYEYDLNMFYTEEFFDTKKVVHVVAD
jgi:16S rRNA (guanine527-N7)-methyltransferase